MGPYRLLVFVLSRCGNLSTLQAVFFDYSMLKTATPAGRKQLASPPHQSYNTPNLNMKKSPSEQAAAVVPHLVRKGSLTTCLTTDSAGVLGNSGIKSDKE